MIKVFVCYKRHPGDGDNLETAQYTAYQVGVEHGFLKLVEDLCRRKSDLYRSRYHLVVDKRKKSPSKVTGIRKFNPGLIGRPEKDGAVPLIDIDSLPARKGADTLNLNTLISFQSFSSTITFS